jgi:threonine/homoserine/homoserine lactone efflux protein
LDARAATVNAPRSAGRLFLQGLGVAVTNPKAILFFTALFPQFLTPGESLALQTVLLTATFTALALVSHAFYVGLFRSLRRFLTEPRHLRLFNRISGGLFVLLGLSLLRLRHRVA